MGNSMSLRFDKLRFVKELTESGQKQQHAEAFARALDNALEQSQSDLATRQDVLELKTEILQLETRLVRELNSLTLKMAGLIIAGVGLLMTFMKFFN